MAELLQNILALIVTLGVLVTIHEYGHFWVARRCGVKVLRFSVGFGRPLLSWYDRHGTEYVVAALPLGGYVKMLDEREAPVAPEELTQAFNRKPVGQRMAIASAGPIANFLFAIAAYTIMFGTGVQTIVPIVGSVEPESLAQRAGLLAGDELVAVDGRSVRGWTEVNLALVERIGESGELIVSVRRSQDDGSRDITLELSDWLSGHVEPDPLRGLGIHPWRPEIEPEVLEVVPGSPADLAGLKAGDLLLSVNGEALPSWHDFVSAVSNAPGQPLALEVQRGEATSLLTLTPQAKETSRGVKGFAGVSVTPPPWPEHMQREIRYGPIDAIGAGIEQTARMTGMILGSLQKMIMGLISVENLGGPITIAKAAGASAGYGVESFLTFLAQLSVMLAVLNLLPIPVLDGGHLLYYSIEWIRGKPLSEAGQLLGIKIGMALLAAVMALALFNDFSRL